MVTGTHYPEGGEERGWEVVYHLLRQPIVNQIPDTNTVFVAEKMLGAQIPVEFEVIINLPNNDTPSAYRATCLGWCRLERKRNLGFGRN